MKYSLKDRETKHRVQQERVLFLTSQSETHHEHTSSAIICEKPVSGFDVKLFQYNVL